MNGKPDSYSRRAFLRCAGAAGLALAGMNVPGANGDIRVAVIGLGNKGSSHVGQFGKMKGVRLAALCDVDPERLDKHKQKQTGKTKGPFCSTDQSRNNDKLLAWAAGACPNSSTKTEPGSMPSKSAKA